MRIIFVTSEYVTENSFDGGLANYLGRICPMLAEMGHDVIVVVSSDRESCFVHEGVVVHRVVAQGRVLLWLNKMTRWRIKSAISWVAKSWAFRDACAQIHHENPIDIIQYASFSATCLFRLKGVPAVVRLSSYEPFWQKAYSWPSSVDNWLRVLLEKIALKKADAVFGPSRVIAEAVSKAFGKSVEVIEPPFVLNNIELDCRSYQRLLDGKKYLLFFGTLGELKGVHTIAEIISTLLQKNKDLFFVFIGKDFGFRGRPMIEYVYEKAGSFRNRVLSLGQMRQSHLYPILAKATAVILPSQIDNLPNACLEAMALERVVVGTRGASFEQLIEDGKSGFLCLPDSPDGLLDSIEMSLTLSEAATAEIGKNAAERIRELRPEKAIAKMVKFYYTNIPK